jgi:ATP-dependent DNA helicase RecG
MKRTALTTRATSELTLALTAGEGQYVEFKEQVSDGLAREMVAFANASGGSIYVGVADNRRIMGLKVTNRLLSQVQDMARKCEPPIGVTLVPFNHQGADLLRIIVEEGSEKTYGCSAGYFLRTGPSSQKMNRSELVRFLRGVGEVRFAEMPCDGLHFPADFSAAAFRSFLTTANITSKDLAREDLLINLGLAVRKGPKLILNNAGALFFARQPRRFHLQSRITCLLFQGTQKTHILDRRDFDGRLVENVDEAMKFLRQHLPVRYEITRLHRREIPALPEAAVREALLNAVIHRDYFERGGVVMVELYQDRLEIVSPGGLPPGLRLEDLGRFSLPRNPLLADLFLRIGYVERAGSGIARIRAAMAEAGLREPAFESNLFFTVRFPLVPGSAHERASLEVKSGAKSGTKSGTKSQQMTQQASILQLCETPQSLVKLMASFDRSDRTKFRQSVIDPLIEAGWIARTVPDRPRSRFQQYVATPAGREQLAKFS